VSPSLEALPNGSFVRADDPGEPTTSQKRVSVSVREAELLAHLAAGKHCFEIGTGLGVSTKAMASRALTVRTFDVDEWVQDHVWPDLPTNVITFTELPSRRTFELCFIDGDHSTEAVQRDIAWALESVPKGVIVCHDVNYENVRDGLHGGDWHIIPTEHGLGLLWRGWT
jgi:predicted O-methyltransferase YrrM